MLILKNLSLRYKIPLRASVLVAVTVILLTAVLVVREQEELRSDLQENALLLSQTLGQNLVTPMLQEDVWRAYELLRTPLLGQDARARERLPFAIVLFDRDWRVLASSEPARYPVLASPEALPGLKGFAPWVRGTQPLPPANGLVNVGVDALGFVSTILADGVVFGHLLLAYSREGISARANRLIVRSILYTLALLGLLLPLTWYWGWRMAQPLIALADSMGKVGKTLPADEDLHLEESNDEVGRAGTAFRQMLQALREKAVLEQEMILNERLAAIGRLTAGVAHEINNPLGGMLNALDTFRRHGGDAAKVGKTLSLMERGLLQIRDTVSAMLV
jgi:signal transduction histidine kinase